MCKKTFLSKKWSLVSLKPLRLCYGSWGWPISYNEIIAVDMTWHFCTHFMTSGLKCLFKWYSLHSVAIYAVQFSINPTALLCFLFVFGLVFILFCLLRTLSGPLYRHFSHQLVKFVWVASSQRYEELTALPVDTTLQDLLTCYQGFSPQQRAAR